jgi:hypothetical protein
MIARFRGRVRLQTDDEFEAMIDVAGIVRQNARRLLRHGKNAFLPLFGEKGKQLFPHPSRSLRRASQERVIAFVGRVVLLDEVTYVNP